MEVCRGSAKLLYTTVTALYYTILYYTMLGEGKWMDGF